jgi:hypothetical protein
MVDPANLPPANAGFDEAAKVAARDTGWEGRGSSHGVRRLSALICDARNRDHDDRVADERPVLRWTYTSFPALDVSSATV